MLASLVASLIIAQAAPESAEALESQARRRSPVVEVVDRAGPAVVNIASEAATSNPFRRRSIFDESWQEYFGVRPQNQPQQSLGSGVIIDKSGLLLTNEHVVSRAANITITLADRRRFQADVVGADPKFDIAVLKIRGGKSLPVVEMGTSSDLMPGETVVAIGNPFGLANSVTSGVVSALHRSIDARERSYEDFIQTDAAINPGNSGGALLNIEGRLIGINTAIYGSGTGIGFAIPVDKARAVVDEVLRYGKVRPVYTGISVEPSGRRGAQVVAVDPKSPAGRAGVSTRDLIVDLSGQEVTSGRAYRALEKALVPGQSVALTVMRGADGATKRVKLSFTVDELSASQALERGRVRLGIEAREERGRLVITRVRKNSHAARVGIRPGDLLLSIGGRELTSNAVFEAVCAAISDHDAVTVVIGRGRLAYYVALELDAP